MFAAGAGAGKSLSAAKIALIFWLSNPTRHGVIVSSTTLDSLESRIWGYVVKLLGEVDPELQIPARVVQGKPPKILYPGQKDKICGMFAAAVRTGTQEKTLSTIIGRHPPGGLLMILDEATDISPNALEASPNLDQGTEFFQMIAIGNSNDKSDLHGALATPKDGWQSIDPMQNFEWPTTHKHGYCFYFNPWDSPAIHEKDPIRKLALSKFLITEDKIIEKESEYGRDSRSFYRFVLGFWQDSGAEDTVVTEKFLKESRVGERPEWSGYYPLNILAGLDPAITPGQKGCVLRFAILGHDVNGNIMLDFRYDELMFYIDTKMTAAKSQELQLTEQIVELVARYKGSLNGFALDATGLGRTLGELIKLKAGSGQEPLRIISSRAFSASDREDMNIVSVPPVEQWMAFKSFIQSGQLRGLDYKTQMQLAKRKIVTDEKTKRQVLESKSDYRVRMAAINPKLAHSPNEADAAALILQLAVRRFGFRVGAKLPVPKQMSAWDEKMTAFLQEKRQESAMRPPVRPASPVATFGQSLDVPWKQEG